MSSKEGALICPLLSIGTLGMSQAPKLRACVGEKCAWWVVTGCAISDPINGLPAMQRWLETISEEMK